VVERRDDIQTSKQLFARLAIEPDSNPPGEHTTP